MGRSEEGLARLLRALDALDEQAERLGGSDESRAAFMARHARFYGDALDLMRRRRRWDDAFHTLERSRARGLLALIGERDLLSAELPGELAPSGGRSTLPTIACSTSYPASPARATSPAGSSWRSWRRCGAAALDVQSRLRSAAPRWAALRLPQPLDVQGARAALDPGTLLLSYAVGPESTLLFALAADGELEVHELDIGAAELRAQAGELRRQILLTRRGGRVAKLQLLARVLGRRLLGPVAGRLARAERLLLVPDGPLHLVPFAALIDPSVSGREAWLVERRPLHVAVSVTLYAELKKSRTPGVGSTGEVVAFGDPVYPGTARAAPVERGLEHARA